jgi:diguanylate cyclase (GGDEF)-like protein
MRGYNDAHGHAAGDELLVRLAGRLEDALMAEGHVYRLGGAHFCAILPSGDAVPAGMAALEAREDGVLCRAATVALPSEAGDVDAALRLADARLAR